MPISLARLYAGLGRSCYVSVFQESWQTLAKGNGGLWGGCVDRCQGEAKQPVQSLRNSEEVTHAQCLQLKGSTKRKGFKTHHKLKSDPNSLTVPHWRAALACRTGVPHWRAALFECLRDEARAEAAASTASSECGE